MPTPVKSAGCSIRSRVVVVYAVDGAEKKQESDDQGRTEHRDLEADRDPDEEEHDDPDAVLLDG